MHGELGHQDPHYKSELAKDLRAGAFRRGSVKLPFARAVNGDQMRAPSAMAGLFLKLQNEKCVVYNQLTTGGGRD